MNKGPAAAGALKINKCLRSKDAGWAERPAFRKRRAKELPEKDGGA